MLGHGGNRRGAALLLAVLCALGAPHASATTSADGVGNQITGYIGSPIAGRAVDGTGNRVFDIVPGPFATRATDGLGNAIGSAALRLDVAGEVEGEIEGDMEGLPEGEGGPEGDPGPEGELLPEGDAEGDPGPAGPHSADRNGDNRIVLSELLRVIQFYNSTGYGCEPGTEDGFAPNDADQNCTPHDSDYNPQDWRITLTELLRIIQFYNSGAYFACPGQGSEDGYCPGTE